MRNYLTKSSFMYGIQCPKRLWMSKRNPLPREDLEPTAVQELGTDIGKCAHNLFLGGKLVDAAPWEHAKAAAMTKELIENPAIPAIFEAAFEADNIRVRVDILERVAGGWKLNEVKSAAHVKDEYLTDIAVQTWVTQKAGCKVISSHLLHIDTSYVRGNQIEWPKLFTSVDVSDKISPWMQNMPALAKGLFAVLFENEAPAIKPDEHCHTPHSCEFWERCTANKPKDWIYYLPRLSQKQWDKLDGLGIESIREIPETYPLSERQKLIRDVLASGKEWVSEELANEIKGITPPCFYLDFETMNPALPLYEGTNPYQRQPFQWSLHRADTNGFLTHWEFLADGSDDPRRKFTESLIATLDDSNEPIVVYSGFENSVLKDMALLYPDLAAPLARIRQRLYDLLGTVRGNYCHPDFFGSYSIKKVAPVLAPEITYAALDLIADGGAASLAFEEMASGRKASEESAKLRQALLAYCKLDTLAMVKVHKALINKAKGT